MPSQRNKLWLKIARSRVVGREHDINEQEEEEEDNKTRLQCRLFRHGQKVHDLSFHAQLPIFATCSEDRTVKVWQQNPVIFLKPRAKVSRDVDPSLMEIGSSA